MCWQERNVTENYVLLDSLQQYAEYCFQIDAYPYKSGGYWSKSVKYCATTGVRGKYIYFYNKSSN